MFITYTLQPCWCPASHDAWPSFPDESALPIISQPEHPGSSGKFPQDSKELWLPANRSSHGRENKYQTLGFHTGHPELLMISVFFFFLLWSRLWVMMCWTPAHPFPISWVSLDLGGGGSAYEQAQQTSITPMLRTGSTIGNPVHFPKYGGMPGPGLSSSMRCTLLPLAAVEVRG